MPRGTHHQLTGLLLEARRGLVLAIDGGGEWSLDAPPSAYKLLGLRVTVKGVRSGFDLLDVEKIERA